MSNFAVIPWSKNYTGDMMFNINSPENKDHKLEPYIEMEKEFQKFGHQIHTLDMYDSVKEVDFFLFFSLEWDIVKQVIEAGSMDRMVYCTAEPPSVCKYNTPNGYKILKRIFPYILTWNDSWVDGRNVFKRNTPYFFIDQRSGIPPYYDRKLLTCISSNKFSNYPGELYSERMNAIDYFENKHSDEFDFYGYGWAKDLHPCYKGEVNNKAEIYRRYRFAICYENIEGLNGYITEKVPDCLVSGIVPIYAGSKDVEKYIPGNCFIRYRDFKGYSELYDFISNMDESEYNGYLIHADDFLGSDKSDYFSGARYCRYILEAISHAKPGYRSSYWAYKAFKLVYGGLFK